MRLKTCLFAIILLLICNIIPFNYRNIPQGYDVTQKIELSLTNFTVTETEIEIENLSFSIDGTIYVLLDKTYTDLTYEKIKEVISIDQHYGYSKMVFKGHEINVKFSDLKSDTTYYIYYFGEGSHEERTEIYIKEVKTAESPHKYTYVKSVDSLFSFFLPIILVTFLYFFIKKVEEGGKRLNSPNPNSPFSKFTDSDPVSFFFFLFSYVLVIAWRNRI